MTYPFIPLCFTKWNSKSQFCIISVCGLEGDFPCMSHVMRNWICLCLCTRTMVGSSTLLYAHNMSEPGDRGPASLAGGAQYELRRTGSIPLRLGLPAHSAPWGRVWGGWTVVRTRAFLWGWGLWLCCFYVTLYCWYFEVVVYFKLHIVYCQQETLSPIIPRT
jgi:hypothetical protein